MSLARCFYHVATGVGTKRTVRMEIKMLKAYINYPNPHVTIHANAECSRIQQQHKKSNG
jgi:hypothetical protein